MAALRSRRFYAWLFLNGLVVRPLLCRLNSQTGHLWGCPDVADGPHNTTGLEVIVAGLGRTGTHGMNLALEELGIKTYGTFEAVYYMPEVYQQTTGPEGLVSMMRSCGVKAFVIEPHNEMLWKLLAVSPDARVILTVRDYDSWVSSTLWGSRTGAGYTLNVAFPLTATLTHLLCDWVPYAPLFRLAARGASFMRSGFGTLLLEHCLSADAGWISMAENLRPDINWMMIVDPPAYADYHERVRFFVPEGQLLEFDMKRHGWAELARFLDLPAPAGGPLPRTGAGSTHFSAMRLQAAPGRIALFWLALVASVGLNWLAFAALWALARPLLPKSLLGEAAKLH